MGHVRPECWADTPAAPIHRLALGCRGATACACDHCLTAPPRSPCPPFILQPGHAPRAGPQGSPALALLAVATLVALAVSNARRLAGAEGGLLGNPGEVARQVLALLAAAAAVVALMFRFGKYLVDAPRLRPDLAQPWIH